MLIFGGAHFFMSLKQIGLIKISFWIKKEHEKYHSREYSFKIRKLDGTAKSKFTYVGLKTH